MGHIYPHVTLTLFFIGLVFFSTICFIVNAVYKIGKNIVKLQLCESAADCALTFKK